MTTTSKVMIGIAGAAVAGAVIGLLFAPEKGEDTRQKIKDSANDWLTQFGDLLKKGKNIAEEKMNSAEQKVRSVQNSITH